MSRSRNSTARYRAMNSRRANRTMNKILSVKLFKVSRKRRRYESEAELTPEQEEAFFNFVEFYGGAFVKTLFYLTVSIIPAIIMNYYYPC